MNSRFGWLLSGPTGKEKPSESSNISLSYFATTKMIEDHTRFTVKKFWQLSIVDEPQSYPKMNNNTWLNNFERKLS